LPRSQPFNALTLLHEAITSSRRRCRYTNFHQLCDTTFALAKGDTLTLDNTLQGSLSQTSDGQGGIMLSFGAAGHEVDIRGVASLPGNSILWA